MNFYINHPAPAINTSTWTILLAYNLQVSTPYRVVVRHNAQDVFVSQGAQGKWAVGADNVMTSLCWTHLISRNVLGKCSRVLRK